MQAQVTALQEEIESKQELLASGPTPMELAELAALSGGRLVTHWGSRQQRREAALTQGLTPVSGWAVVECSY